MSDTLWIRRCIDLARRAEGQTAPNPMVGAVIVKDGKNIADGWHRAAGQAHAEVDALQQLGGKAPNTTMYVNLEPCCHHGRTAPCTDAILASGISRVVVGMVDPDKRVQGRGIAILRNAGITVDVGVEAEACRQLNTAYLFAKEKGRPLVTLKAALTLDGRIAAANGESQWITSPSARAVGHALRHTHDAVLVGSGTLLKDDPRLNTRLTDTQPCHHALPVVLDTHLRCPVDARILKQDRRPVLYCGEQATIQDLNADIVPTPVNGKGQLELSDVLEDLLQRGVHRLLVEGGSEVHRSFFEADLVDQVELFLAPKILAGGPGWVGGPPLTLEDAPQLTIQSVQQIGSDIHVIATRRDNYNPLSVITNPVSGNSGSEV